MLVEMAPPSLALYYFFLIKFLEEQWNLLKDKNHNCLWIVYLLVLVHVFDFKGLRWPLKVNCNPYNYFVSKEVLTWRKCKTGFFNVIKAAWSSTPKGGEGGGMSKFKNSKMGRFIGAIPGENNFIIWKLTVLSWPT